MRGLGLAPGYRRFIWPWWKHWLDPRTYWYAAEVFIHRVRYGWCYRDVWSIDYYLSAVFVEMLEHYLETSHHLFFEDADADWPHEEWWSVEERQAMRDGLQKKSEIQRVIAAFKADQQECTTLMCDHARQFDERKAHAEHWRGERAWAFGWLQEHWNGLWT